MMKLSFLLSVTAILFTACKKSSTPVSPESAITIRRSIVYTNSNNTPKVDQYSSPYNIRTEATVSSKFDEFALSFNALPELRVGIGEAVAFVIKKSELNAAYEGIYTTEQVPSFYSRYTCYLENSGVSTIQHPFSNQPDRSKVSALLNITKYDKNLSTINGSFEIRIKEAIDPTKFDNTIPSTNDNCYVIIKGEFSNVKINTAN